jgi:hypothetical protein
MNQNELIHKWANGLNDATSGGAVYVTNGILLSYGFHFPLGVRCGQVNGKPAFLLNSRSYSVSTTKHQGWTNGATHHGERLFVPLDLSGNGSGSRPFDQYMNAATATHCERSIAQGEAGTLSKGSRKRAEALAAIHAAVDIAKRYETFAKAYGATIDAATRRRFAKVAKWDESRLSGLAERLADDKRKAEAKAKRDAAKQRKEQREALARWVAGENTRTYFGELELRLKDDNVETSQGATVPADAARLLWAAWKAGKDFTGRHVGYYVVNEQTPDAVQIGCHTIDRPTAERFAARVGW